MRTGVGTLGCRGEGARIGPARSARVTRRAGCRPRVTSRPATGRYDRLPRITVNPRWRRSAWPTGAPRLRDHPDAGIVSVAVHPARRREADPEGPGVRRPSPTPAGEGLRRGAVGQGEG